MADRMTQYLPSYTVGTGAYSAVPQVVGNACVVAVGGGKALAAALPRLTAALAGSATELAGSVWYGGQATFENVEMLVSDQAVRKADALLAVGGGKAIDTCKVVAHRLGKPLYTLPTIASNCSPVSRISIMYNADGSFREIVPFDEPPVHCFIDMQVMATAPSLYLWAGIGDTLAKYHEVTFSMRGDRPAYGAVLGQMVSRMCDEPLLSCAREAYRDACAGRVSDALEHAVMNIVVSTGIVSGLVGVDYNSALAHALFYGLTTIPRVEREHLHGEVVSYGVLVQLAMDGDDERLARLLPFYRSLGLPTRLADLGLSLKDDFSGVLEATECNQELRHVPYPVTQGLIWDAIVRLEEVSAACATPAVLPPSLPDDGKAA